MTVTVAVLIASVVALILLLWRHVPAQAAILACSQEPLPLVTSVVLFVASWFFRVLPFVIIFGGPVALVLGVMIAGVFIKARGRQAFARHVTRLAILTTCGVLVGCGMILFAMR